MIPDGVDQSTRVSSSRQVASIHLPSADSFDAQSCPTVLCPGAQPCSTPHVTGTIGMQPSNTSLMLELGLELSGFERLQDHPKKAYDSTTHLIHFIRTCRNNLGLSQHDIDSLLKMLFHPSFDLNSISLRNVRDVEHFEDDLYKGEQVSLFN